MENTPKKDSWLSRLLSKKLFHDLKWAQGSSYINQALTLGTTIVLIKFLEIETYGIYVSCLAFYNLLVMFTKISITKALISDLAQAYQNKDETRIKELLLFKAKIGLGVALLQLVIGLFLCQLIATYVYKKPSFGIFAVPLFFQSFLLLPYGTMIEVLTAQRKIREASVLKSLYTFFLNAGLIGAACYGSTMGDKITAMMWVWPAAALMGSLAALTRYHYCMAPFSFLSIFLSAWQGKILGNIRKSIEITVDGWFIRLTEIYPKNLLIIYSDAVGIAHFDLAIKLFNFTFAATNNASSALIPKFAADIAKRDFSRIFRNYWRINFTGWGIRLAMVGLIWLALDPIVGWFENAYNESKTIWKYMILFSLPMGFGLANTSLVIGLNRVLFFLKLKAITFVVCALPMAALIKWEMAIGAGWAFAGYRTLLMLVGSFFVVRMVTQLRKEQATSP